jgi:hypothetical protein
MKLWRFCVSVHLIAAVLLVSIGAHSVAFHSWFHGDEIGCSLTHQSHAEKTSGEDTSKERQEHEHGDPLEPFCQTGHLLQVIAETSVFEQPRVSESILRGSIDPASLSLCPSCPTRAPPVLI